MRNKGIERGVGKGKLSRTFFFFLGSEWGGGGRSSCFPFLEIEGDSMHFHKMKKFKRIPLGRG